MVPLKSAEIVGCRRKRWFDHIVVLSSAAAEPHLSWFIIRSRANIWRRHPRIDSHAKAVHSTSQGAETISLAAAAISHSSRSVAGRQVEGGAGAQQQQQWQKQRIMQSKPNQKVTWKSCIRWRVSRWEIPLRPIPPYPLHQPRDFVSTTANSEEIFQ